MAPFRLFHSSSRRQFGRRGCELRQGVHTLLLPWGLHAFGVSLSNIGLKHALLSAKHRRKPGLVICCSPPVLLFLNLHFHLHISTSSHLHIFTSSAISHDFNVQTITSFSFHDTLLIDPHFSRQLDFSRPKRGSKRRQIRLSANFCKHFHHSPGFLRYNASCDQQQQSGRSPITLIAPTYGATYSQVLEDL